jgi:galactokinase
MSEPEAERKARLFELAEAQLRVPQNVETLRWFVPGRIEVLGKHTDYAGGRSLLCTAERGFCLTAMPRRDKLLRIADVARHVSCELEIASELQIPSAGWTVFPSVIARRLAANFPGALRGADICFASDLPSAAGMSSSSALVVSIFAALSAINRLAEREEYTATIHSVTDLAGYLGCVENGQTYHGLIGDSGVGTFGGSEDHTAILTSEPGRLKQYSFCPVRHEQTVQLPEASVFVIAVSGVVADKTGAAKDRYNQASLSASAVLKAWKSATGSDVSSLAAAIASTPDAPEQIRANIGHLDTNDTNRQRLLGRFEQFRLESECIIPRASDALARHDLPFFGDLVDQSQKAAEELLGNQIPETIALAHSARALGAYAASAFGAGFGGSVWALVPKNGAPQFASNWRKAYESSFPGQAETAEFFQTAPGPPLIQIP